MKQEPAWRRYLRFWGSDPKSDIEDEFEFHIQAKTDELIAGGLPPEEARREAVRQFGSVRAIRKECHAISSGREEEASRAEYFAGWLRDLTYAVRMLSKTKASSITAILILAVGIGANTAVFTCLDRLLYRPLPVPQPSQLLLVSSPNFTYDAYLHLRDRNQAFSGLAAQSILVAYERRRRERLEQPAQARAVSGNFFDVLQTPALIGRALAPSDDVQSDASHVAVASHRFWSRRFNQAPDALGRTVYLNNVPFTIVGVLPKGFFGLSKGSDPDLYVPLGALTDLFDSKPLSQGKFMSLFGRMKPDSSLKTARSNLQTVWEPPSRGDQPGSASIEVEDGSSGYAGTSGQKRSSLMLLAAIVALLLLIGCVNVACLLVARGAARQQEIAIRISLGAGKTRIVRQSLIESLLLASVGGVAGMVVALGAGRLLLIAFQWKSRPIDLSPDWRVLAFAAGVSLATGLLFGLAPAMQCLRDGRVALNQERTVAPFTSGKALVVMEVALSLVMVAGAAVFIRSFQNLRSTPVGFIAERVSVIRLAFAEDDHTDLRPPAREAMRLAESLWDSRGLESAAVADKATFNDGAVGYPVTRPGGPSLSAFIIRADQKYFETLRMPLISGRGFNGRDDDSSPKVAVLGESAAHKLFPNMNPVGKTIRVGLRDEVEVIGVVKDIKFMSVRTQPPELVYRPLLQGANHSPMVRLHVRSRISPSNVAAIVRDRIREEHLPVSVESFSALEDEIGASLLDDRIRMQTSSVFGALALLLITAGIYGLMAHSAVRRTREIGIRMAVGSSPAQIVRLMLNESARLVLIGVILGVPGALAVMKAISGLVFGLPPIDGVSLAVAAVILSITGIAASVGPAWRAARFDPVNALRLE